jgi:DAK2 domain fusion protein YloV
VRAVPEDRQGHEGALAQVSELVGAALASLEASRQRIDDLNVYPVPDGDTGTNMTLSVRAVADALARSEAASEQEVAHDVTRAALMGARGNSGVILSQLLRGAAESLASVRPLGPAELARALRAASDAGYASLRDPQEGTILTVARAMADRAEEIAGEGVDVGEALAEVVVRGEVALAGTRDQLPQLREAGVVDAGGAGLVEILRGLAGHVRGEPLPELPPELERVPLEAVHLEPSRYRYCTSFFVEGPAARPEQLEGELAAFGDSLLVVGSPGAVKVHVHTDDPGRAMGIATAVGVVGEVEIKNMHAQTADRTERLAREVLLTGAVAVATGSGNRVLLESLGARVVDGGETMNPSTADLVAAIEAEPAAEIVLLPNDPNVFLAAEQAALAASKSVSVVPTRSLQAGLGALVAYDGTRAAAENAEEMAAAAAGVRSGAVARASRNAEVDGLRVAAGEFLGLADERAVATGPALEPVLLAVAGRLAGGAGVLTVLAGSDADPPDRLVELLAARFPSLEVEVHDGGQQHHLYLLGAE